MENQLNNEVVESKLGTLPLGLTPLKKKVQSKRESKIDKTTASFKLKEIIKNKVPKGQEFITSYISDAFKNLGYRNSDLSGQLYSLKTSGYLENRRLTDEQDIETYGKGIRIWRATDKFYDYMDMVEENSQSLDETVAEEGPEYKEENSNEKS